MSEFGTTTLKLTLPAGTEEWADELLMGMEACDSVHRDGPTGLLNAYFVMGGNTGTLGVLSAVARDLDDALQEGEIAPKSFTLTANWEPEE